MYDSTRFHSLSSTDGSSSTLAQDIAIDHIGFGLSDKPYDVSYLPQFHAENLARFIDALNLKNITLVVHDWGGPISMSYALNHPSNIHRIFVSNRWFWSVKGTKPLPKSRSFNSLPA